MYQQAKPIDGLDSAWRNVDGPLTEDFPSIDTVDKLFSHIAKLNGEKPALGTRELLEIHEERQPNGRVFEKVTVLISGISVVLCL